MIKEAVASLCRHLSHRTAVAHLSSKVPHSTHPVPHSAHHVPQMSQKRLVSDSALRRQLVKHGNGGSELSAGGTTLFTRNSGRDDLDNVNVKTIFTGNGRDSLGNNVDTIKPIFTGYGRGNIGDGAVKRSYVSKKTYPFSELKKEDLEEMFVRGSGPGGQAVNQTANCVVLKHLPTGIVVKCHETRSLPQNRERARERLRERLDLHLNGDNSFLAQRQEEASLRRKEKKKKNKDRLELKKAFKDREGID